MMRTSEHYTALDRKAFGYLYSYLSNHMPRKPNFKSPVVVIRTQLKMSREQFADFIDHGAAMLKMVECGRKKMSASLRRKIHQATLISWEMLEKEEWTETEAKQVLSNGFSPGLSPVRMSAFKGVLNGSRHMNRLPAELLPQIMGTWFAMLHAGFNPRYLIEALESELTDVIRRFDLSPVTTQSFEQAIGSRLFPAGRKGAGDVMIEALLDSEPYRFARKLRESYESEWKAETTSTAKRHKRDEAQEQSTRERIMRHRTSTRSRK